VKLSVKVEYACRVLAQLAKHYGSPELAHIEKLAGKEAVPANYLVQILSDLRNGGLIMSRRGKQGGYALARSPEMISLYEIVSLVDGDLLEFSSNTDGESGQRVSSIWKEVRDDLEAKTRSYTLDMFLSKGADDMYYI
jgi:Rrf2 family cysteine metabolism transcriptional repressor